MGVIERVAEVRRKKREVSFNGKLMEGFVLPLRTRTPQLLSNSDSDHRLQITDYRFILGVK